MMRLAALPGVLALLAGCQAPPPLSEEQIAALDYGPRPENYERIVREYLQDRLNEPNFAVVEFKAGPARLYQRETLSRERQHGWAVCVMINDRDPHGVYPGFYPMVVYVRGGKVVAADGGGLERAAGLRYAHAQCKQLGYEVFDRRF
ncbi:MAG TPA: hypothetical protein VMS53_00205 [Burkholderiales bacterium]|nr:hypothetical protein [Burkholderiales bacterium]